MIDVLELEPLQEEKEAGGKSTRQAHAERAEEFLRNNSGRCFHSYEIADALELVGKERSSFLKAINYVANNSVDTRIAVRGSSEKMKEYYYATDEELASLSLTNSVE